MFNYLWRYIAWNWNFKRFELTFSLLFWFFNIEVMILQTSDQAFAKKTATLIFYAKLAFQIPAILHLAMLCPAPTKLFNASCSMLQSVWTQSPASWSWNINFNAISCSLALKRRLVVRDLSCFESARPYRKANAELQSILFFSFERRIAFCSDLWKLVV